MAEPAGIWIRVSSGQQDEQNQVPDCETHCAARGYQVTRTYTVHGKSASKGHHQADLDKMLADMKSGVIKVLVIWHSDRIERRPGKALLDLLEEVSEAGGRVESVKEPALGQVDFGSQVTTFIAGLVNHEKSKHISDEVTAAFGTIKANGALNGRPPFGYTATGEKYNRALVPTADGLTYVPEIYQRVIAGESLRDIGAWLDGKGVKPSSSARWWPRTLSAIVRNQTYMGRRTDAAGKVIHTCEALVDSATWKAAGKALDSRPPRATRGHTSDSPAMLSGVLFCPVCDDSPMYRFTCGGGARSTPYYRCTGRGPQRKGCGLMVRCNLVDAAVHQIAARTFCTPVMITRTIPGHDYTAALEDVRLGIRDLADRDLTDEEYDGELARLRAERKRLSALPSVPEQKVTEPGGETYKELWDALEDAQRGSWLKRHGFRVTASKTAVKITQPGHPKQVTATVKLTAGEAAA